MLCIFFFIVHYIAKWKSLPQVQPVADVLFRCMCSAPVCVHTLYTEMSVRACGSLHNAQYDMHGAYHHFHRQCGCEYDDLVDFH